MMLKKIKTEISYNITLQAAINLFFPRKFQTADLESGLDERSKMEFFVVIGVFCFLYSLGMLIYYIFFEEDNTANATTVTSSILSPPVIVIIFIFYY